MVEAKNMQLVRAMYDWGIMRNDKITVNGAEIGILDCIGEYLFHSKEGQETELYGYSLHVEVIGTKDGKKYSMSSITPTLLLTALFPVGKNCAPTPATSAFRWRLPPS